MVLAVLTGGMGLWSIYRHIQNIYNTDNLHQDPVYGTEFHTLYLTHFLIGTGRNFNFSVLFKKYFIVLYFYAIFLLYHPCRMFLLTF